MDEQVIGSSATNSKRGLKDGVVLGILSYPLLLLVLWRNFFSLSFFFFFFVVLGPELRAYTLSHSTKPFFVVGFFEIGSQELFAWAGFK
jgi:hypothetical protein